jgi:hypothetical protein
MVDYSKEAVLYDAVGMDIDFVLRILEDLEHKESPDEPVNTQLGAAILALKAMDAKLEAIQERHGFLVDKCFNAVAFDLKYKLSLESGNGGSPAEE